MRTYVPEPQSAHARRWTDKPAELKEAVYANRRRTKPEKHSRLQKLRSERVERSFGHVCETGGARRTRLMGIEKLRKRLLITTAARNLGLLMRKLFGIGTPRALQGLHACSLKQLAATVQTLLIRLLATRQSTRC